MKAVIADYRYRVICLRIVPVTGSPIYLTRHVRDLVMGGHTYLSASGYDFSGYSATAGFSPSLIDLEGISGLAGIGYNEIASGIFDNARAYLFATTWNAPVEDEEPIVASFLGKATLMDQSYKIEEIGLLDALNQSVGLTYTAACSRTFGDAGCGISLPSLTVTGTLTGVTSSLIVRDSARGEAADYFAYGTLAFTSGANAGLKRREIKRHEADGTIEVFEPFHYPPVIGDAYSLIPGCRKRLQDCRDKYSNILNFFGFTNVPTSSQYSQVGAS